MNTGDRIWLWAAMTASVVALIWVAGLLFGGVRLNKHCAYFVPVRSHPGVLSCSKKPEAKP